MEKTNILNKYMSNTLHALMMLLFLWCGVTAASAQGTGTIEDPFVLSADGGTYTSETNKIYGVFTAPSEGELVINETYSFFTDAKFTTQDESMQPTFNGNYANKEYSYTVEAGKKYYVYAYSWTKSITMKFRTEAEPLELQSVSPNPAENEIFNAGKGTLDLQFNQPVTIGGCELKAGSNTENVAVNVRDVYAIVDAKNTLAKYYTDGTLNEGADIIFKFTDVKRVADGVLYNGDGVVEVKFKSGPKPLMLVSSTGTPESETPVNDFKSYYMQKDPNGMIMLTYSGNVGSVGDVTLTYGTTDGSGEEGAASSYYSETITPKILDNTVVVDFRGKLRRHADMLPGYDTTFPTITLKIAGVKDVNGNSAFSSGLGTVGAYSFTYNYSEVDYTPTVDWNAENTTIGNDTKSIELWLNEEGGNATFTGVEFAYTDGGETKTAVVNANDLKIEADTEFATAKIITVPVPNVAFPAGDVTVNLTGVETPDGLDHDYSAVIACTGKTVADFQITSAMLHAAGGDVEMVNGTIGTIANKTTATITTTKEVGYMTWELTDKDGNSLKQSYGSPKASTFDVTFRGAELKCLEGNTYTFTLKAWNTEAESRTSAANPTVGTATFTFTGTEKEYVYSDVKLLNDINDEIDVNTLTDGKYVLNFDGDVTVKASINLGFGTSQECTAEPVDGDNKKWAVTVSSTYDVFELSVWAKDAEGHAVNKTAVELKDPSSHLYGSEDNTWFNISFVQEQAQSKADFNISPENGSELESIDQLVFSFRTGIAAREDADPIEVWNMTTHQQIAEISASDIHFNEKDFSDLNLYYEFETPITEPGTYDIVVPDGFFTLGEQFETYSSNAATITYVIKGASSGTEVTVTPASESTVEKLDKITFTYVGGINVSNNGENITVQKREDSMTYTDVTSFNADDVQYDFADADNMWINFAEPITEPGLYIVTVPAGFFNLGESGDATNDVMVLYYEVKEQTTEDGFEISVNPAGGNVTEIPAQIVVTAAGRSMIGNGESAITLTDADSKSYNVSLDIDWNLEMNQLAINLADDAITAAGTYTLTIPEGAINGDSETDTNKELVVVYIIGTTGIDNMVANAGSKVDVYAINGTNILRNANATAVKSLAKGLYIINGKKVVIK